MENSSNTLMSSLGVLLSAYGVTISISELQAIISIIVTIAGFLLTVLSSVVIPLIKKLKKAKSDGKITVEELEDIVEDTKENISKLDKK